MHIAAEIAVACEATTQVPAELTVAQWALESAWGACQPGNNCFGIKAYEGCYGTQTLETTEIIGGIREEVPQEFATFPNLGACFEKHAMLICQGAPYANTWAEYMKCRKLEVLIRGIAPIYSTEGTVYADTLLEIIAMHALQSAISAARSKLQP